MAWWRRLLTTTETASLATTKLNPFFPRTSSALLSSPKLHGLLIKPNPSRFLPSFPFSTSFLVTKLPKKFKKRKKKESPRTTLIQHESSRIAHFERLVDRDDHLRFLTRSKQFISKQPEHILRLDDAGKLWRELGYPRGRKVNKYVAKHPLLFEIYRHADNKMWLGFTDLMENLIEEESRVFTEVEEKRVKVVKKLLMMSREKRMPLSKIYHCRLIFGMPEDFRDWVLKFPDDFRVSKGGDGTRMLELVGWDEKLAVSALEKEFMADEEKVMRAFRFPLKNAKALELELDDERKLNQLNTLPLVSPYSDGWKHDLWSLEAEKYRVGVVHEFLSLTLEKRALIHHIVEFKEEFSLTKHTYQMLLKQPRSFYLAGTEMNWAVFLRDAYDQNGVLIEKDPQVVFNEKLYNYARKQKEDLDSDPS